MGVVVLGVLLRLGAGAWMGGGDGRRHRRLRC